MIDSLLAFKDKDGAPLVDHILDTAGQKGTGKWTVIDSAELALRFRFTTRSPPNWRCCQSANNAGVSEPSKPAMMTAPTSATARPKLH